MVDEMAEKMALAMAQHLGRCKVGMMVYLMVDLMDLKDWSMVLHLVLTALSSAVLWEL